MLKTYETDKRRESVKKEVGRKTKTPERNTKGIHRGRSQGLLELGKGKINKYGKEEMTK